MLVDDIAGQSRTGGSWFLYSQLTLSNFTSLLVRSSEIEKNKFNYFRPIDNISCKRKFLLSLDALKKKKFNNSFGFKRISMIFFPCRRTHFAQNPAAPEKSLIFDVSVSRLSRLNNSFWTDSEIVSTSSRPETLPPDRIDRRGGGVSQGEAVQITASPPGWLNGTTPSYVWEL